MSEELSIFRELLANTPQGSTYADVFKRYAALQDKVTTILFCPKQELAYYLTCEDTTLRELATRRYKSYE